jgi:hypothetical protein
MVAFESHATVPRFSARLERMGTKGVTNTEATPVAAVENGSVMLFVRHPF